MIPLSELRLLATKLLSSKRVTQITLANNAVINPAQLNRFLKAKGDTGLGSELSERLHQVLQALDPDAQPQVLPPEISKQLAIKLRDKRLILFVGAGLSHLCPPLQNGVERLPLWKRFTEQVVQAQFIEDEVSLDDFSGSLTEVFDYLVSLDNGDARVKLAVREVFKPGQYRLSSTHEALSHLPWAEVWTTNYDRLLEDALGNLPTINGEKDFAQIKLLQKTNKPLPQYVLHLHGTVEDPHTLGSESYRYWERDNPRLHNLLKERLLNYSVLFVGYGLGDPNLDAILSWVRAASKDNELSLYGLFWQMPKARLNLLKTRDKIEGFSVANEAQWVDTFKQLDGELAKINLPAATSTVVTAAADITPAVPRHRLAQALRHLWDDSGAAHLFIGGAQYTSKQIGVDDIFVPPDIIDSSSRLLLSSDQARFSNASLVDITDAESSSCRITEMQQLACNSLKDHRVALQNDEDEYAPYQEQRIVATQALQQHRCLVLLGEPGGGKSLLLRHTTRMALSRWADDKTNAEPLPIYLKLNAFAGKLHGHGADTLLKTIMESLPQWSDISPEQVQALIHGKAGIWWLLDGIDELRSASERTHLRDAVQALQRTRPQDRFSLSARPSGYTVPIGEPFQVFQLASLNDMQVRHLLDNWQKLAQKQGDLPILAADLDQGMRSNPGLTRMRRNPLLLTLAVLFYRTNHRLPRDRWEYYHHADQNLRGFWLRHRFAQDPTADRKEWSKLLGKLALQGMKEGVVRFSLDQVQAIVDTYYADQKVGYTQRRHEVDEFIAAADDLIGVVVAFAPQEYGFLHLSFQEYHAAAELLRLSPIDFEVVASTEWDNPDWQELWALFHQGADQDGKHSTITQLWQAALNNSAALDTRLYRPQKAILGWLQYCSGNMLNTPPWKITEKWWHDQFAQGGAARDDAIQTVAECPTRWPHTIQTVLIKGMLEIKSSIRWSAVQALRTQADEPHVQAALLQALSIKDEYISWSVLRALQPQAAEPAVQTELLKIMSDDDVSSHMRGYIVQALCSQAAEPAVQAVLFKMLAEKNKFVRWTVAHAIGTQAAESAVQAALLKTISDENADVRSSTVLALRTQAAEPIVQAALLKAMEDKNAGVRSSAGRALGEQSAEPVVQAALLKAMEDKNAGVRASAAQALDEQAAEPVVQAALLKAIADKNADIRTSATRSLGTQATKPVVQAALLKVIADKNAEVRCAAAFVLSTQAAEPAVQAALLKAMEDKNAGVRASAVQALDEQAAEPATQAALLKAIADKNAEVRCAAAHVLSTQAAEPAVQAVLLKAMEDKNAEVRCAAALVLSTQAAEPAVQAALLAALAKEDLSVRSVAANVLSEIARTHRMLNKRSATVI